jgi:hypothetical protein
MKLNPVRIEDSSLEVLKQEDLKLRRLFGVFRNERGSATSLN